MNKRDSLKIPQNAKKSFFYAILRILVLIFVVFLVGCGQESGESGSSQYKKRTQISVNNGALEGDEKRLEEQKLINDLFMKKYPNAKIYFDSWQFSPESFMLRMSGGTCTDVVGLFASEATTVIEKKLAADITDLVKSWDKYQYINESVLKPITYEGRIYGLPVGGVGGSYVMTLFYNKEIFKNAGIEKTPDSWEEFVQTAGKLTNREKGIAGFGILGEKGGAGWHFLNWVWQAGGYFEVKENGKWKAVFDSPEAVTALQFIKDLRWKHRVLQEDIMCDNDDLFEYFAAERIAMAIFTPEYLVHLVEKYEMPFEKIGIALLPEGPGGRANQMGGAYNIINPTLPKEKQKLAFTRMTFDYDLETIELRCKILKRQERIFGFGVIPVFHGEYQDKVEAIVDKYRTIPGQKELMRKAVKYVRPEPPYYSQQLYSEFLGPAVQEVLTNQDADPAKLLKSAARDFQRRFLDNVTVKR